MSEDKDLIKKLEKEVDDQLDNDISYIQSKVTEFTKLLLERYFEDSPWSAKDSFSEGIAIAAKEWFDEHNEEIIEKIAEHLSDNIKVEISKKGKK